MDIEKIIEKFYDNKTCHKNNNIENIRFMLLDYIIYYYSRKKLERFVNMDDIKLSITRSVILKRNEFYK